MKSYTLLHEVCFPPRLGDRTRGLYIKCMLCVAIDQQVRK